MFSFGEGQNAGYSPPGLYPDGMHIEDPQGGRGALGPAVSTMPSRREAQHAARAAFRAGSTVVIHSKPGYGRSTLLWRLSAEPARPGTETLTLLGSAALRNIAFAHLASLATRVPEFAGYVTDPLGSSQALAARFAAQPLRVLVDDAEHIDVETAAVLAQLVGVGVVQLALTVNDPAALPAEFRSVLAHAATVDVTLGEIDTSDAKVMLEGELGQRVNASSVTHLLLAADGNPAQLSQLAQAAQRDGKLVSARGYLVFVSDETGDLGPGTDLTAEQWYARSATGVPLGDRARALSSLAPHIAEGDPEARLLAGRIEITNGDRGHGATLLTPQPGDSEYFRAASAFCLAQAGATFDPGQFEEWSENPELGTELRLALISAVMVHDCYSGDPTRGVERGFAALDGPLWSNAKGIDGGALLYSLYLAIACEGAHELTYVPRLGKIDWDSLAIDHGLFIASRAHASLDTGRAAETLDLVHQVLALADIGDPYAIAGFIAGLGAGAAAMLEDPERARELLTIYRNSSISSGQLLHPEAQRHALGAILIVEGEAAARSEFERLRDTAVEGGMRYLAMRLEHEAWRLRLHDSLDALAAAAEGVTGQLAAALRRLPDRDAIEDIASSQHADGRTLYAAEFLAEAARTERASGNKVRAQTLLTQAAELADTLPGVNTPRIARVRVDPELLTAREIEVCMRAAAGLSNVEIADELFLSQRTVEGHLQRAYAKLGVSDRRQLLPLTADQGLPD